MKTISTKQYVNPILNQLKDLNTSNSDKSSISEEQWRLLDSQILAHRVKFPILEYAAVELAEIFSSTQIEDLLFKIAKARHISSYPVIGKLLQLQLGTDLENIYQNAIDHIIQGDKWYACDIISERVFGVGTLKDFELSLRLMTKMGEHDNQWIQRSIGIATHYATKKGLPKHQAEQLFMLMLSHGHKTSLYIKKGIGWPAKTVARFHPDLIYKHEVLIKSHKLSKWFKNKINIGLSMAKQPPISYE